MTKAALTSKLLSKGIVDRIIISISYRVDVDIILKAHYTCEIVIKLHGLNKELRVCVGIVNGVTHAVSGGGGEVQQWWRVGPHGVVSQEV